MNKDNVKQASPPIREQPVVRHPAVFRGKMRLSTLSELKHDTLMAYRNSELLERDTENDEPIYMHHANCRGYCDYACNSGHGQDIAQDISFIEGYA